MDFEFKNRYIEPMSEDIPLIKVNSEELKSLDKDISKKDREDMYLLVSKDTIPFERVIVELDESIESLYITRTEYSFDTSYWKSVFFKRTKSKDGFGKNRNV